MATDMLANILLILGFIIGLGAVTVIDIHGVLGTRSSYWTEATIRTHKVTKPLIWIGTGFVIAGSLLAPEYPGRPWQLLSLLVLVANGSYLSLVVSPYLLTREKQGRAAEILPKQWQIAIAASFVVSVFGWWGNVGYFIWTLSQ